MLNILKSKTDRAAELRAELTRVQADLIAARKRLGISIADGDERAAKSAREDVARCERLADELRSAIPVAEARVAREAQAEAERARKASEKAANEQRAKRIAAAKRVDEALRKLGAAYTEYLATAPGGRPEDRNRLARRSRHAIAAATFTAAPEFANAMEPRYRPLSRLHWASLTSAVEKTIGEYAVEPEPHAEDDSE
jgi:hypothetical protein